MEWLAGSSSRSDPPQPPRIGETMIDRRRSRWLPLLGGLFVWVLTPCWASAGPIISIDDLLDGNPIVTVNGTFDPATLNVHTNPETAGIHVEWVSTGPVPNPGTAVTSNVNIFGALGTAEALLISDTLSVTFSGQTPTTQDPNNVSADLSFVSDTE